MPYIKTEMRSKLDPHIDSLSSAIVELNENEFAGNLNYTINKLIQSILTKKNDHLSLSKYSDWNEVVGALECAKIEIYRRLIAPYEDIKITENGDVESSINNKKS